MSQSVFEQNELLTLPSDQDASGRTLGEEELALLAEVVRTGTLTSTKGEFVRTLEQRFASVVGVGHALACASGSAAVHAAVAGVLAAFGDINFTNLVCVELSRESHRAHTMVFEALRFLREAERQTAAQASAATQG